MPAQKQLLLISAGDVRRCLTQETEHWHVLMRITGVCSSWPAVTARTVRFTGTCYLMLMALPNNSFPSTGARRHHCTSGQGQEANRCATYTRCLTNAPVHVHKEMA